MKWLNAEQQVTVTIYDEEHEEYLDKIMTVEEMLDTYTNEGCPTIYSNPEPARWVPVSERLPEDRRLVLVTAYWHETYQVMMASYFGDGLWWCVPFNNCGAHMQRLNPKAWMPLPEPYRA